MKKIIVSIFAVALLSGFIISSGSDVSAYKGDPGERGPNCTDERHEAMEKAFEKNDYNAWKELMQGKGRVTQVVNEKNFAKFAESHNLAEQGKVDEAKKIREELGLGLGNGSGKGQGMGYGRNNQK